MIDISIADCKRAAPCLSKNFFFAFLSMRLTTPNQAILPQLLPVTPWNSPANPLNPKPLPVEEK